MALKEELLNAMDNQFRDVQGIAHRAGHGSYSERDTVGSRMAQLVREGKAIRRDIGGRMFYRLPPKVKLEKIAGDPKDFDRNNRKWKDEGL